MCPSPISEKVLSNDMNTVCEASVYFYVSIRGGGSVPQWVVHITSPSDATWKRKGLQRLYNDSLKKLNLRIINLAPCHGNLTLQLVPNHENTLFLFVQHNV